MNVNFELYRIFYIVANHGNITKASEELLISQPAISKAIKNLEDQLGGQLFVRKDSSKLRTQKRQLLKQLRNGFEVDYGCEKIQKVLSQSK